MIELLLAFLTFSYQSQLRSLEAATLTLNMTNIALTEYYITITNNANIYKMKVDTGSDYMTLASSEQLNSHTTNLFTCSGSCSKSATETVATYGDSLSMTGNIATDGFTIGGKDVTGLQFLLAKSEVGFGAMVCDGLLGLGLGSFFDSDNSGIMYYLLSQTIVPLKQVGIYLSSTKDDSTSQITLGGFDTTKAVSVKWLPVSSDSSWTVAVNGYKIGSTKTTANSTLLMTTGLSYSFIPSAVYDKYIAEVRKKYTTCEVFNGTIFFGCVIKSLEDVKGFPELSVMIGEETFTFGVDKFVTSFKADDGNFVALAMVDKLDGDLWMVGTNFMRGRYMIFNGENKTIGISGAENKIAFGLVLALLLLL